MQKNKSKVIAFTLVEVLIVIAIVGAIAAVTIPTLIKKYNEIVTVNKVKRTYSMFYEAFKLAIAENGDIDGWKVANNFSSSTALAFFNYIKPYLKISEYCGSKTTCYTSGLKNLNGVGAATSYNVNANYYKFTLQDGTVAWLRTTNSFCHESDGGRKDICAVLWFDINGKSMPNQFGVDIFVSYISPQGPTAPKGESSSYLCTTANHGWRCLRYILDNGNMKYLQ